MKTFRKWQDGFNAGFNETNWLAVEVKKFGQGSTKRYVDSCCIVRVIDEKGEAIGILHQTIQNANKHINVMYTTMGGMGQELHSMGKDMKYYAAKIHLRTNALR